MMGLVAHRVGCVHEGHCHSGLGVHKGHWTCWLCAQGALVSWVACVRGSSRGWLACTRLVHRERYLHLSSLQGSGIGDDGRQAQAYVGAHLWHGACLLGKPGASGFERLMCEKTSACVAGMTKSQRSSWTVSIMFHARVRAWASAGGADSCAA